MSTRSTDRRFGIPLTFAAVLLIVAMSEAGAYRDRAEWIRDYWNRFTLSEPRLIESPGEFRYLLLGNSIQKTGIRPAELDPEFLSLGLPGAKPLSHYFLLKRYLAGHAAPERIFLYLDPFDERLNFQLVLRYFFNDAEFGEARPDLNREERDAYFSRVIAMIDRRQEWRLKFRPKAEGSYDDFVRSLIANRGYMPAATSSQKLDATNFDPSDPGFDQSIRFSFKPRDWKYLDKLLALCRENDIRVRIGELVFPAELQARAAENGFLRDYDGFWDELKRKYPWVEFAPSALVAAPKERFGDIEHLNAEGSRWYTRYFFQEVLEPLRSPEAALAAV